jgi:hypothetical protein
VLLEALRPSLHMQAAQYSNAVGAWGAAARHYMAAAAAAAGTGDPLLEPQARCLAAMARLAQGGPDAGAAALGGLCVRDGARRWGPRKGPACAIAKRDARRLPLFGAAACRFV